MAVKAELVCCLLCLLLVTCGRGTRVDDSIPIEPPHPQVVDTYPRWSPTDSAGVAYTHLPDSPEEERAYGGPTVWIADPTAGQAQLVAAGSVLDWAPDGSAILVKRGGDLILINISTKEERCIGGQFQNCLEPDISPSGHKIAYVIDEMPAYGIWILDLDTMSSHWIYHGYGPDWSPDGSTILCDSLVLIDENGSRLGKVPYPSRLGYPGYGRWSPDGKRIVFVARGDKQDACIWTVGRDGSDLTMISCGGTTPSWSPGSTKLAYAALSGDGKASAIWVMNADGSNRRQITFPKPSD